MGHYKKGKKRGASSNKDVELNAIDMALVMPDVSAESWISSERLKESIKPVELIVLIFLVP